MASLQPKSKKSNQAGLALTAEQAAALEALDGFVQGEEKLYL
jgi:hypothetical protein